MFNASFCEKYILFCKMNINFLKLLRVRHVSLILKHKLSVCIVGAGPAGFYAAMHITKNVPNITIDIIEKLPVPFGLIRFLFIYFYLHL